jgi:hypothetical protein
MLSIVIVGLGVIATAVGALGIDIYVAKKISTATPDSNNPALF